MSLSEFLSSLCCCASSQGKLRPIRSNVEDWRTHPTVQEYILLEVIGEGGFSEVWLAEHQLTKDKAALKVVYLSKPGLNKTAASILEGEAKFLQLLDHPNILRCKAVLETKFDLVLVLEHLSGGELLDHLRSVHHFDEGQAAALMRQVVEAVAYMHDLSIMHRDIKPENVLFVKPVDWYHQHQQPWKVKLIDLGMAAVFNARCPANGCLGSPGFIAPEVVYGGVHTPAMDIYSLGALLFVMLTGRKVFDIRDVHTLQCAQLSIQKAPGLNDSRFKASSPAVQELILSMMADDPGHRPTAHQVLSHAWIRGEAGGTNRPVIDAVVRRRMLQLANLRRYKGLAFTLMTIDHNDVGLPNASASSFSSFSSLASLDELNSPNRAKHLTPSASNLSPRPGHAVAAHMRHGSDLQQQQQEGSTAGSASEHPGHTPLSSRSVTPLKRDSLARDSLLKAIHRQRRVVHNEIRSRSHARRQGGAGAGADAAAGQQLPNKPQPIQSGHRQPSRKRRGNQEGCIGALGISTIAGVQDDGAAAVTGAHVISAHLQHVHHRFSDTGSDLSMDSELDHDVSGRWYGEDSPRQHHHHLDQLEAAIPEDHVADAREETASGHAHGADEFDGEAERPSCASLIMSHTSQEALITVPRSDDPRHLFRQPAVPTAIPDRAPTPASTPQPMQSAFASQDLPPELLAACSMPLAEADPAHNQVHGVPSLPRHHSHRGMLDRGLRTRVSLRRQGPKRSTSDGGGANPRQSTQAAMELALVATALQGAPQLVRAWTAPEPGTVPNMLENAIGAAAPRLFDSGQQARAMSLDVITLAFLDGEQHLRQLLGDATSDLLMSFASLRRRGSTGTQPDTAHESELPLSFQPSLIQEVLSLREALPHEAVPPLPRTTHPGHQQERKQSQ